MLVVTASSINGRTACLRTAPAQFYKWENCLLTISINGKNCVKTTEESDR
jgi:hypothetical protein